jgi:signal transduction histidine kinase
MNWLLVLSCAWVLASAGVAMLPMRRQYVPGILLLIAAPVLIVLIGLHYGWVFAALGLAAFLSMFRNPLRYILLRVSGHHPEVPK